MSQMLSPTTTAVSIGAFSRAAAAKNRSGSGLAYLTWSRVTTGFAPGRRRAAQGHRRRFHPAARRDGPTKPALVSHDNNSRAPGSGRMCIAHTGDRRSCGLGAVARCGPRSISTPVSRTSWLVNRPPLMAILRWMRRNRQLDAFAVERFLPGQDVLIDAVDQRAVEVEEENRLDAHRPDLLGWDVARARAAPNEAGRGNGASARVALSIAN